MISNKTAWYLKFQYGIKNNASFSAFGDIFSGFFRGCVCGQKYDFRHRYR